MSIRVPYLPDDKGKPIPTYSRNGDAGIDLRANEDFVIEPFERIVVSTGFKMAIPEGYAGLVLPRSGLAIHHGITVPNGPGLIDSNYRGDIGVILINLDPNETYYGKAGDRIAQLMLVEAPMFKFIPVDSLDETNRGESGFGSSGK